MHRRDLKYEEGQVVLESHMFLKQKWNGKINVQTVSGGKKQWTYIPKEYASSPTISTEYVLLTSIVDAKENRDVSVIDIPNAFIQTRVEEKKYMAIINIRGVLVDIICKISSYYKAYVTRGKRGVNNLLLHCQNALYGTIVVSLLYYRKFTKSLESIGFDINPYDTCVANKVVDGSQITIFFHVDDCKMTHR